MRGTTGWCNHPTDDLLRHLAVAISYHLKDSNIIRFKWHFVPSPNCRDPVEPYIEVGIVDIPGHLFVTKLLMTRRFA